MKNYWKVTWGDDGKVSVQKNYNPYENKVINNVPENQNLNQTQYMLGRLASMEKQSPGSSLQGFEMLNHLMQDSTSRYYSPYAAPTNKAVSNLTALGFDVSLLNDSFFKENEQWMRDNLIYNGTTNTPSILHRS